MQAVAALERRIVLLEQLPRDLQQGRRLRVITGRGLHSTDGEASLPRVISSFLEEQKASCGWRITYQLGAIEVLLSRQVARQPQPVCYLQPANAVLEGAEGVP
jgi:hypothetical protein